MFIFNTQKFHSFIQNYIMIIAWTYLKCKLCVFHIKTLQVENTHHFYKNNIFIFYVIYIFSSPQTLHKHIILKFSHELYWKFVILKICDENQWIYIIFISNIGYNFQKQNDSINPKINMIITNFYVIVFFFCLNV